MKAILIHLELTSPLLLTQVGSGDENSSLTQGFIPGGALRGALVARYLAAREEIADLMADENARALFFGEVRYLNAYPAQTRNRLLPTPASWRKEKGADERGKLELFDEALRQPDDKKDVRLSSPFYLPRRGEIRLGRPGMILNLHIAGEGRGSVKRNQNTLYQYQALAAGQPFSAAILAEKEDQLDEIRKLLEQDLDLALGRSRSAEYGQVHITAIEPESGCLDNWQEAQPDSLPSFVTVTFLSDALLREENGQPSLDFDGYLSRILNRKINNQKAFVNPTLVSGFNRKWGAPLPQMPAIGMGSVFVYASKDLDPAELAALVESGVGERQVEGFGRIALNLSTATTINVEAAPRVTMPPVPDLCSESQKIAQGMSARLLRRRLDDRLVEMVKDYEISGKIQNSQLGRLRSISRSCLADKNLSVQPVLDFLDTKYLKETARKQFESARIGKARARLYYWVIDRAKNIDALEEYLGFSTAQVPLIAGERAPITTELKQEYTLRLIEAVVDRKMKSNRQEGAE